MRENPNPKLIDEMCDAFMWYQETHENCQAVDMSDYILHYSALEEKNYCGSPGCHAGLFALLFETDDESVIPYIDRNYYFRGAQMMAKYLFESDRPSREHLKKWARYSGFWPNHYGSELFANPEAFDVHNTQIVPIKQIVKTWKQVAKNIRKAEK